MKKGRYFMGRTMAALGGKGVARLGLVAALVAIGLLMAAPSAQAIVYNLTSDHCTGSCGTPPFGQVELIQNGANVSVTVTLFNNNKFVNTGAGDNQWFKFNAIGVAVGDITITQNFGAHPLVASTGAYNGDGT